MAGMTTVTQSSVTSSASVNETKGVVNSNRDGGFDSARMPRVDRQSELGAGQDLSSSNVTSEKAEEQKTVRAIKISSRNGSSIYSVTAPKGMKLCDRNGNEYRTDTSDGVHVRIANGYKMTLYLKDVATGALSMDEHGRLQTMEVVNIQSSPSVQTKSFFQTKETSKGEQSVKTGNNDETIQPKKENKKEEIKEPAVTKGDTKYDVYGRQYSSYQITLPENVRLANANGQIYGKDQNSVTNISVFVGYKSTFYLKDEQGRFVRNDDGSFKTIVVTNKSELNNLSTPNNQQSNEKSIETSKVPSKTQSSDSVTTLVNGLVDLKNVTEQRVVTVQQPIYGPFGGYRGTQNVNRRTQISTTEATINVGKGNNIYFLSGDKAPVLNEQGKITFRTDIPVTFVLDKGGEQKVYTLNPKTKACEDITSSENGSKALESYNTRELSLVAGAENVLRAGEYVHLTRDENNTISSIIVNVNDGYGEYLTRQSDGTFQNSAGNVVKNISLKANGELSFKVDSKGDDGKTTKIIHTVTSEGVHTEAESRYSLLDGGAQVQEYAEFQNTNSTEVANGIEKIARSGYVDAETQTADAEKTIQDAQSKGVTPIFFLSYHGNTNYNRGVGTDSGWLTRINDAAKKYGYDGPIVIEMHHCHSGVSHAETEVMKSFPAGSILIKSQDSRLAYHWFNSHSADGETLEQAKNPSPVASVAYFSSKVISQRNNPTVAITSHDGNVKIYSENGQYPGSSDNGTLSALDNKQIVDRMEGSRMNPLMTNPPQAQFLLRCLAQASQEASF